MKPEERLEKFIIEVKGFRSFGKRQHFTDTIKKEAIEITKIYGVERVAKAANISHSLLRNWRKKLLNGYIPTPALNITHVTTQNSQTQNPLITFFKNDLRCEMYSEAISVKVMEKFLQ